VGMGVVPAYPLGRVFRDLSGRVNQVLAAAADRVWMVVCGIPQQLK
jgi:adenosylcobinamide kinase / adenosylcobinamide-phosphate guanylyltransferase